MSAVGYAGTPLARKLGIRDGQRIAAQNAPPNYWALLGPLPRGVTIATAESSHLDVVHVFVRERAGLESLLRVLRGRIRESGMIWVSWPKKASGVMTDVTEDVVRQAALAARLVDVKVAAIDETWSGLKLVIRVRDRGRKSR